ncbi:hypothetical protein TVAG_091890 [Trichomonas vaginalis G3]|uniref:Uncharacterized protein n=1 Tax=Trichomonas vaginalis (strain ATCC PRA-98 / G3) TaxID=412133 RepID=A2FN54_TRIV3|nr:hypothetical protein TVAGG3_0585350 [Trichomonas vaginalis G3]EAX93654.1 hypothetical protein TVAG_091890 [Trichomonas vaginalis G3]KAI5522848.1 hypothetical protein TVAGG3_0585350 [Trichomonas vaginalis G3]|eukprot:XP_001306584.1 hypothetical protein [Trichomonas vaginalis G3]
MSIANSSFSDVSSIIDQKLQMTPRDQKLLEDNLNSDIESAHLQITALENRKIALEKENNDLKFEIAECEVELDAYSAESPSFNENDPQGFASQDFIPQDVSFFQGYSKLESYLALKEAELEASNVLRAELKDKKGKLHQIEKELKEKLQRTLEIYDKEVTKEKSSNDILLDLKSKKISAQNALIQTAENSELVLSQVNAETNDQETLKQKTEELTAELNKQRKEYEAYLAKEKNLITVVNQKRQLAELNKQKSQNDIQNIASIKSWEAERKSLISNIKMLKNQTNQEKTHIIGNQKIISDLENRFMKLFNDKDSNCIRARAIALAELHELQAPPTVEEISDANAEESYYQELVRRKELLEKSLGTLESFYKNSTLMLNEEEKSSKGRDYLDLLDSEYNELQAELNKLF